MAETKPTDNLLIENAILAFKHHYPEHRWAAYYADLLSKLKSLKDEQSEDTPVQKRGRPAKRARTKKASTSEASKDANKSTT